MVPRIVANLGLEQHVRRAIFKNLNYLSSNRPVCIKIKLFENDLLTRQLQRKSNVVARYYRQRSRLFGIDMPGSSHNGVDVHGFLCKKKKNVSIIQRQSSLRVQEG